MHPALWTPHRSLAPSALADLAIERCRALATMTEQAGVITRTFLSPPMHEVHLALGTLMTGLGMTWHVDAAGNLRGLAEGRHSSASRIVIGSHLDTVPNAGAYDGILGVVLGLTLVEALDRRLGFAIEVIGFSEEEGVRFGLPFLGSQALVGTLSPAHLATVDRQGTSVRQAIVDFGLDPAALPAAVYHPDTRAYLEFHIEQGPVLESLNLPLAAVDSIVGQSRWTLRFAGQANHAGTTPMALRRDALAGAAEWIGVVERAGHATPALVATVGRLHVAPGAGNVVPAEAEASLDVRHAEDSVRRSIVDALLDEAAAIAQRRGLTLERTRLLDQSAVPCDPGLTTRLCRAIETAGYTPHRMPSGAGHDAMVVAPHLPTALLFLRSPGGISHHPSETVLPADVAAALTAGVCFLTNLDEDS